MQRARAHAGRGGVTVAAPMPVLFVIRSLEVGGAERQLSTLVRGLDRTRFEPTVLTFYDGGALRGELGGITVRSAGKRGRWDTAGFLARLRRLARAARPAIVHGYMGVANELSLWLGRSTGAPVVWGLRASDVDPAAYDRATRTVTHLGARLSRFPDLIIANSWAGREYHASLGYDVSRLVVIPNGIDVSRFRPDAEAGQRLRAAWGVGSAPLIGIVARLDPMKDHATFLRAAALVVRAHPEARFVCVGNGRADLAATLQAQATALDLTDRVRWVPADADPVAIYNALDILTSTSAFGEGFSNVVGEAMACGIPCVVTDVGDASRIVGPAGVVVPRRDAEAVAKAVTALLECTSDARRAAGAAARARIVAEFPVERMVAETQTALASIARRVPS